MTQRYDTYKDSGVQWLGEIPGHWGCVRLKNVCTGFSNGTTADQVDFLDGTVSVTRIETISKGIINYEKVGHVQYSNNLLNYRLQVGDILFSHINSYERVGNCALYEGEHPLYHGMNLMRITPISKFAHYKFIHYYLISPLFLKQVQLKCKPAINQVSIPGKYVKDLRLTLPPLSEQRSIVSFLDSKCGKIDEWVTKKQKEVENLQELKQRVIADAVTRGLNPHVKMKATNIPWLKEIPEHWEMSKISSHFRQRNEKVSDKDYPALSVSKQGVTPQLDNVALSNAEGASRKLVKVGDYAVNSRSDRKGSCGVSKYEGSVSLITIVLEPFNINGEYIHYLFRSNLWVEEFYRNGRGIVADLWTTNYQMMKSMYMPVPPIEEQKQIVSYLDAKCSKIDKLIANITKEIECIKEYKQRLISDVVTGQIKVC